MGLSAPARAGRRDLAPSRSRAAALGLAALILGVAVGLFAVEGLVRLLRPQPLVTVTPGLYQPDPPLRYRLTPGHRGTVSNGVEFDTAVAIDERGLRVPATSAGPATLSADRPRILVLGDSFVFGWGVEAEETFVARLARAGGVAGVALNGGVPGYGLPDAAAWFERYGRRLEPDLVILAVFVGNDLLDATEEYRRVVITDDGLVAHQQPAGGLRAWIHRHFHLVRLAKRALPMGLRLRWRAAAGLPEPRMLTYLRDSVQSYARRPPPLVEAGRASTGDALARLDDAVGDAGATLALFLVPDALQVDDDRWRAILRQIGADPAAFERELPMRFFAALAAERGVPILDPLAAFRAAERAGEPMYFTFDPHWNVAGHRLAAAELERFLRARGLLDTRAKTDEGSADGHSAG